LRLHQGQGVGRQGHFADALGLLVRDPGEALAPAAVFVFFAAAAGAGGVAGVLTSRHAFLRRGQGDGEETSTPRGFYLASAGARDLLFKGSSVAGAEVVRSPGAAQAGASD